MRKCFIQSSKLHVSNNNIVPLTDIKQTPTGKNVYSYNNFQFNIILNIMTIFL